MQEKNRPPAQLGFNNSPSVVGKYYEREEGRKRLDEISGTIWKSAGGGASKKEWGQDLSLISGRLTTLKAGSQGGGG